MTNPRDEYGHPDPWEEFDEADWDWEEWFGADALYAGPHETIQDVILLTEVVLDFEVWAEEFRSHDRNTSKTPASLWEQDSRFSITQSIQLAKQEAQQ